MGTNTLTLEAVQARIRHHVQRAAAKPQAPGPLKWGLETAYTQVTTCNTYRVSKARAEENGPWGYWLWSVATPSMSPKKLAGPFPNFRQAQYAAEAHRRGDPMQAALE